MGLGALCVLGGCNNVQYTSAQMSAREPELAAAAPLGGPSHSSAWAGVLPSDDVNSSPLAMAEYNQDLARNDPSLGVVTGPPGEPLTYYATADAPSMFWQYQFTLPANANSVTVFRRGSDMVYWRPVRSYYRVP